MIAPIKPPTKPPLPTPRRCQIRAKRTKSFLLLFFNKEVLACLLLSACASPPFGIPQPYPGHPIITSGYFSLPDGASLPYRLYAPPGPPKAVVLALHGVEDSRDAWEILSQTLVPAGIAIYAPDQSSFGATKNRGHWPGTSTMVNEARDMALQLREKYPHTKLVLMGQSMGGAILIILGASSNPPPVESYVILAPAVWGGAALNPLYRMLSDLAAAAIPGHRITPKTQLAFHIKASDNLPALYALGEDPLTIHAPRVDQVNGLVHLMGTAQADCAHFSQPALLLYGGNDQLVPPEAMKSCWRAIPATAPVTFAFYPPDYHLLERDLERATPNADILAYIQGQSLPSGAPTQATIFLAN
jgi:alpha-beta hydrolase superfamily lysophospholipase